MRRCGATLFKLRFGSRLTRLPNAQDCLDRIQQHYQFESTCKGDDRRIRSQGSAERIRESSEGVAVDYLLYAVEEKVEVVRRHCGHERVRDVCCRKQHRVGVRRRIRYRRCDRRVGVLYGMNYVVGRGWR